MPSFKKEEKKVCVKLSCVVVKKPTIQKKPVVVKKPVVQKKAVVKKHIIKKKVITKPKKLKKPKIKPKPKPKPKKVKIIKEIPIAMPPKKEEIVEPEVKIEKVEKKAEVIPKEEVVEVVEEDVSSSKTTKEEQLLQEYYQDNLAKIAQLLRDNLYYPRSARKRGIVGEVIVRFRLATDAEVYDIEVVSSKSEILSRAAKKTIKNLSGEFPKPKEELILKVPIEYRLRR